MEYKLSTHYERPLSLDVDDFRLDMAMHSVVPGLHMPHGPHITDLAVDSTISLPQIESPPIAIGNTAVTTYIPVAIIPSMSLTVEVV